MVRLGFLRVETGDSISQESGLCLVKRSLILFRGKIKFGALGLRSLVQIVR